jgi:hypothetical protein
MKCVASADGSQRIHYAYDEIVCFQGLHLIAFIISCILIILFVSISFLFSVGYFNPRVFLKESFNRDLSKCITIQTLIKAIISMVGILENTSAYVLLFFLILSGMVLSYCFIFKNPFYDSRVAFCYKFGNFLFLWTGLFCFAIQMLNSLFEVDGILAWVVSLPFVFLAFLYIHINAGEKITNENQNNELNAQTIREHVKHVLYAIDTYAIDSRKELDLRKVIIWHRNLSKNKTPGLENFMNVELDKGKSQKLIQMVLLSLKCMMSDFLEESKNSNDFRIFYIVFLTDRLSFYKDALSEINLVFQFNSTFEQRLIAFRYKKSIELNMMNGNDYDNANMQFNSELMSLLGDNIHIVKFTDLINKIIKVKISILSEFITDKPSIETIYQKSYEFNKRVNTLQSVWEKIKEANMVDHRLFQIYGKFMVEILLSNKKGNLMISKAKEQILKNSKTMQKHMEDTQNLPGSMNISLVYVNSSQELIFNKANNGYCSLLGYETNVLEGQSLFKVFPRAYENLKKHIKDTSNNHENNLDAENSYFGKEKDIFVRKITNFVIPASSIVRPLTNNATSSRIKLFINVITPKARPKNYVNFLVGPFHQIFDYSSAATF